MIYQADLKLLRLYRWLNLGALIRASSLPLFEAQLGPEVVDKLRWYLGLPHQV